MTSAWRSGKLGELVDIELGRTPSRSSTLLWDKEKVTNNVWLSIADLLKAEDGFALDSREYISDRGASLCKLVPKGTLLVSFKLTLGRLAFAGRDLYTNEAIAALTILDERTVSKEFLFWFLQFFDWRAAAEGDVKIKGMTLNKAKLKEIVVRFPALSEQQRIVAMLDEAFASIATARANAEASLRKAEAIRVEFLRSLFDHRSSDGCEDVTSLPPSPDRASSASSDVRPGATKTGGRAAALRHIPGDLSLSVGMPARGARQGWRWVELSKLARLESGHTPSRRHAEYWGGDIPWLSIRDARAHHGEHISETEEQTNELGISKSSARVLPAGTVCLSRTASVGYVTVTKRPMATSQDFVNWVCLSALNPDFLKYIFLAEGREGLLRYASGAVHQTIYYPEAKAFHICCPDRAEQDRVVAQCDSVTGESWRLADIYRRKLAALDELKQSLLHQAFSGQL